MSYFKECNDLAGKPKLFFIQACRRIDVGPKEDPRETRENDDLNRSLCQPDASDILVGHSTIKGNLSYRDIRTGSWYIQTLIKKIRSHAKNSHLMEIMTLVNNAVAANESNGKRQMPVQISTLKKLIHFKVTTDVIQKTNE